MIGIAIFGLVTLFIGGIVVVILALTVKVKEDNSQIKRYEEVNKYYVYEKVEKIVTDYELKLYWILKDYTERKRLTILSKVRLADIVKVKENAMNKNVWFSKIRSKHIDFVICTQNLIPILSIELDDSTHNRKDRIERDKFINDVHESIRLPILHIYKIDKEEIERYLNGILFNETYTKNY